ncbi:hypothetical protein DHEL01_v201451 [Diaporthe helianthi]|uniref:Uncharacterized protein n=1 Tax=Diaporthe helianthi TaxID=158607 RepID=A0A2P5ICC4_DIAHE|nr:hypothetical protein DHEL01_v201451 [Diaporthe helianthi]
MPEHGLDVAILLLLLAEQTGAASIRRKLELRQDDDGGINTPDDDDDAVPAPAPAPATATATPSAATTSTASPGRQLDTGSKAGIAIGVIVFVIFLGGVVFMYWRHRQRRRWERRNKDSNNNTTTNYNNNYTRQYPNQPNMVMAAHNGPRKSGSDSSPPLGSISPPSTNPDAGRPWFDNGHGSSELLSRGARDSDGVAGWVNDKAELSAPGVGVAQAPAELHPHHQYSNSTELATADNQIHEIHEIPEFSACSYAPVELPAAVPDQNARYSGGYGEDIGRNVSTRTSNTDRSANRRESLAPTFTVSSPATTVAETVSDSGHGNHVGQVSPASPSAYARSAAGGNTI